MLCKFGPAPWFLTFKQSFLSFQLQNTRHKVIFSKFVKLDPDPGSWILDPGENQLDPD